MATLEELISQLERQNEVVGKARNEYLSLEAERKHYEARMIQNAEGKSHAERQTNAQAEIGWLAFHKKLARAEAVYEFQRFKLEILDKEWLARYAALKSDTHMIKRQGA